MSTSVKKLFKKSYLKRKISFLIILFFLSLLIIGYNLQNDKQVQPESLKEINIAYPSAGTMISGQTGLIMQKTDILKQNGLNAKIFPMATGKEMKSALLAGQVDVILTSESNFVVLLGADFEAYGIASLGTDGKMGLVVNADSDIYDISDIKGGKIATIFGTSVHKPAIEWAKKGGLTPAKDVEIVNIGGGGALRTALLLNEVDAIVNWDPFLTDGLNKGQHRVLATTNLDLIVVMSADYADKNPVALSSFKNALKEASFYMSQHKEDITQWYGELAKLDASFIDQVSQTNHNYNAKTIEDIDITISQEFTTKLIEIADFMYNEGLIEKNPDILKYIKK